MLGCSTGMRVPETTAGGGGAATTPLSPNGVPAPLGPLTGSLTHPKSRWVPVDWSELPGFADDPTHEGWSAMISNCARPNAAFAPLCQDVRRLAIADADLQRRWMMQRLQPYRVESLTGQTDGQLTSYYEPVYDASRRPTAQFNVPLYAVPDGLAPRRAWYTRQQIETLPEAQAALRGREIAWMADPVDAMMLHIQGSGRLRLTDADGSQRVVRMAYAATNEQPYRSIQAWLSARARAA